MKTRIVAAVALLLAAHAAGWAQAACPKSKKAGVHVVQPGENLFRISKKYGVSVANLCAWNGISENAPLSKCTELMVAAPKIGVATRPSAAPSSPTLPTDDSPESAVIRQAQAERRGIAVRPAESQPSAAPATAAPSSSPQKMPGEAAFTTDDVHVVQEGETIDQIAAMYGYRTWRFREINGLSENEEVAPGRLLRNSECAAPGRIRPIRQSNPGAAASSPSGSAAPSEGRENWSAAPSSAAPQPGNVVENEQIRTQTRPKQTEAEKAAEAAAAKANAAKPSTRTDANFMTVNERTMVDEINLMRGNPAGYIPYVEAYIEDQRKNGEFGSSIATAKELIGELRNTPRLSILEPSECVYRAAKKHGQEQARKGSIDHQGVNGSWPWDRILESCKGFEDGNENLVGGYTDVRKSVIILLVDDGIDNRGHRRTLLEPKWKYVACYEIGPVKPYADYWVQNFGN